MMNVCLVPRMPKMCAEFYENGQLLVLLLLIQFSIIGSGAAEAGILRSFHGGELCRGRNGGSIFVLLFLLVLVLF